MAVDEEEDAVRTEALNAVRDLETAVQVGITENDYTHYVIEAKRKLGRLEAKAPAAAMWWRQIQAAMADYEFALGAWRWKSSAGCLRESVDQGSAEFTKARERYRDERLLGPLPLGGGPVSIDHVMQTAWVSASWHIMYASRPLLEFRDAGGRVKNLIALDRKAPRAAPPAPQAAGAATGCGTMLFAAVVGTVASLLLWLYGAAAGASGGP